MELLVIPLIISLFALITPNALMKILSIVGSIASIVVGVTHAVFYNTNHGFVKLNNGFDEKSLGFTGILGYDGISLMMILLVNVVILLVALSAYKSEIASQRRFTAMLFLMQFALVGVFLSFDGLLFYIFWELTLIPVFLIAYWYGIGEKRKVLMKFFIYTFVGSLGMLLALILIKQYAYSFAYGDLLMAQLPVKAAFWIMGGFFLAFAIKIPLLPFHTWQPDTYTLAPSAGTMLLSALMLKMALYGMIRWMLPLAPEALGDYRDLIIVLGVIGVIYAAVVAIKMNDMKRLFAYASISHVGLIAAGIVIWNLNSLQGAMIQMINHGLIAVALFFAVEIIVRRRNTTQLSELGGIATLAPKFAFWFAVIGFASVSVPFTSGFIGEFLLIKGVYDYHWILGGIVGLTIILGAVYTFRAYQLSMFGAPSAGSTFEDLHWSEILVFAIISGLVVLLGVYPKLVLDFTGPSFENLLKLI